MLSWKPESAAIYIIVVSLSVAPLSRLHFKIILDWGKTGTARDKTGTARDKKLQPGTKQGQPGTKHG